MKKLCALLFAAAINLVFAESLPIKFALARGDGDKYRFEFEEHEKQAEFYAGNGIKATLLDTRDCMNPTTPEEFARDLQSLKRFHDVCVSPGDEGVRALTPEKAKCAEAIGKLLVAYMKEGGGVILQPCSVRYPGNDDEKFWNIVYAQFGFHQEHEGLCDKHTWLKLPLKMSWKADFWRTDNILDSPLTQGVRHLWLPVRAYTGYPAVPLIDYQDFSWEVVVKGNDTCKSYLTTELNAFDLKNRGKAQSAPAIVAWRQVGKGRLAVVPIHYIYTGINYRKEAWSDVCEDKGYHGKKTGDYPSDMMKLMANIVRFLAEPSLGNPAFGTYQTPKYEPVTFPERVSWDAAKCWPCHNAVTGIVGAHSSLTDGQNTIAEYAAAAKSAGLQSIVFTEPLELLTEAKFKILKTECAKATTGEFYAVPGVEFTDGSGIRWVFMSEKILWPGNMTETNRGFEFQTLGADGKILLYGKYAISCFLPPSAIVDYRALDAHHVRRENLWWFFNIFPLCFEAGADGTMKQIADNRDQVAWSAHDLRVINPLPFTRIRSAAQLPAAAAAANFSMKDIATEKEFFLSMAQQRFPAEHANLSVNYGSRIAVNLWDATNSQQDPRSLHTRGCQRVKAFVDVESPDGIREIQVIDDNGKVWRRLDGRGEKHVVQELELVQDEQHNPYLVVTDLNGKQALTRPILIFDYKQGLFRCGDNLNILGPLGYWWHPDRNELLPLLKQFRNGEFYSIQGWDRAQSDCPVPYGRLQNIIFDQTKGELMPKPGPDGMIPAIRMSTAANSGEMQVIDAVMDEFAQGNDNAVRTTGPHNSPVRILQENEYFTHTQRLYSYRDRMDHHIAWDHRRLRESLLHYGGAIHYFTGEITFKQEVTLARNMNNVPVWLAMAFIEPQGVTGGMPGDLVLKNAAGQIESHAIGGPKGLTGFNGQVAPDGFIAEMKSPLGYLALFPLDGTPWNYSYISNFLCFGPGERGRTCRKGEVLRYAFAEVNVLSDQHDAARMGELARLLRGAFPIACQAGSTTDATGLLRIAAQGHEAAFTLGPKTGLGIDVPVALSGVMDNDCVAVYSTARPWFRFIPVGDDEDIAYFQEPMEEKNEIWAGNVFYSDNPALKLILVADGQDAGKPPFLQVSNPGTTEVTAKLTSPAHAPRFGGTVLSVKVPAGAIVNVPLPAE